MLSPRICDEHGEIITGCVPCILKVADQQIERWAGALELLADA